MATKKKTTKKATKARKSSAPTAKQKAARAKFKVLAAKARKIRKANPSVSLKTAFARAKKE
jgi:hypothetical protein